MGSKEPVLYENLSLFMTRTADKSQRKLDKPLRLLIRDSLNRIAQSPQEVGEKLSTPLSRVYSHHIKYKGREFRIAYLIRPESESVVILLIGAHENFYRKLKNIVDATDVAA